MSSWKAEFDLTMERIRQSIAETNQALDEMREMREGREPRERHLRLVPQPEGEGDDA